MRQILAAVYEYHSKEEQRQQSDYEKLRLLAFFNVKPQYGNELTKPEELIIFPWERELIANKQKAREEAERRGNEILRKWKEADKTNSWKKTAINQTDLYKILKSA